MLSDGQANVGPSSPTELGDLGASLSKDGITVTTIGLGTGYNEDLMANLAGYSDGNHAFVKDAEDLARVFKYEFGDDEYQWSRKMLKSLSAEEMALV